MKNIDVKSILIGVLATALLFAYADADKTSPSIVPEAKAQESIAASLSGMVGRYQTWPEYGGGIGMVDPSTGLPVGGGGLPVGGGGLPGGGVPGVGPAAAGGVPVPDVELQLFDTVTGNYYVMPRKGEDRLWRLMAKLK